MDADYVEQKVAEFNKGQIGMQRERIADELFQKLLLLVSWSKCEIQQSRLGGPSMLYDIESAAREYKAAGGTWEEYT